MLIFKEIQLLPDIFLGTYMVYLFIYRYFEIKTDNAKTVFRQIFPPEVVESYLILINSYFCLN